MKIFASILALLIISLSLKPAVDVLSSHVDSCCHPTEEQAHVMEHGLASSNNEPEKEKDHCSDMNCNPFQICSSCIFHCFDTAKPFLFVALVKPIQQHESAFLENQVSKFVPEFWQPPKIV